MSWPLPRPPRIPHSQSFVKSLKLHPSTHMLAALRKAVSGPISQICICALIGFLVGLLLNLSSAAPEWAEWLGMPGELYLRMLTLLPNV